ncbi:glutaredoxin family protein [Bacillaceae bacterium S4-13-58]
MTQHQVTVYISDGCQDCKRVITFLENIGIEFKEKNITIEPSYKKELREEHIYGTPAIFVGSEIILGFQPNKIRRVLQLYN